MHAGLNHLLNTLKLTPVELSATSTTLIDFQYTGQAHDDSGERLFGGQVMAQAVSAGYLSLKQDPRLTEDYWLHSIHSNFLRPGIIGETLTFNVRVLRNGRSYLARSVEVLQRDKTILIAQLSFHKHEEGLSQSCPMPDAPDPESLVSEQQRIAAYFKQQGRESNYGWPIDIRHVTPPEFEQTAPRPARDLVWMKAADAVDRDIETHHQLLVYASDNPIMLPAFHPFGITPLMPTVSAATLLHTLWIHKASRFDQWHLFDISSDITFGGRGMGRAKIFNPSGELVASAVQEGVTRTIG